MSLGFGILGAGRIGKLHTRNLVGAVEGVHVVAAVLIVSPTTLRADQMKKAARAGKAIFCEKPVALKLAETVEAMAVVKDTRVPFQLVFARGNSCYAEPQERALC